MRKYSILILIVSLCYSIEDIYNIKLYGLNVAQCYVDIKDTLIDHSNYVKLRYKVNSTSIMKWFFNVNNHYETILDKNTFDILYFKKNTTQPKVTNQFETILVNDSVQYKDSHYYINNGERNIFSLLYLLSINKNDLNEVNLDREGKKYLCKINFNENKMIYTLEFDEIDENERGLVLNTDIFTWALFLDNTIRTIKVDPIKNKIDYCKFKKGLMSFVAKRVESN